MKNKNLDKLTPDEKKVWWQIESYLKSQHGETDISLSNLGKEIDTPSSTLSRRLKRFKELGLIRLERQGKGRYNVTRITLIGYEDSPQEDNFLFISPIGGVIPLDSPFYIKRASDQKCTQALIQNNLSKRNFVRIKGYRESGKSSMLVRLIRFLESETDQEVALVDLSSNVFSPDSFEDPHKLFYQFTYAVTESFNSYLKIHNLKKHLDDSWNADITPAPGSKSTNYLRENVFSKLPQPSTLLIDGVDAVLGHEKTQNPFLGLLRTWNEQEMKNVGQGRTVWTNIVVAYSTEPYLAYGIEGSVFHNVGIEVKLSEFDADQINRLAKLYRLYYWNDQQTIELMNLIDGYPALIQQAFYILCQDSSNDKILSKILQSSRVFFEDHLLHKLKILQADRSKRLINCFVKILQGKDSSDVFAEFQLEKAGLIKKNENGEKKVIELYRQYFQDVLEISM